MLIIETLLKQGSDQGKSDYIKFFVVKIIYTI